VVLFNILQAFERRNLDKDRVIGTLLGNHDKSGNVEITNSFVVAHRVTNGEVAIDIDAANELLELYRKVNASENIVGWFATGETSHNVPDVNEYSVLIHDYYSRETAVPVHLTVSPNKDLSDVVIKAYVSTPIGVPGKTLGTLFAPVSSLSKVAGYESELVGLKACMASNQILGQTKGRGQYNPGGFDSEIEMILTAASKCSENIGVLTKFIDDHILSNQTGRAPPPFANEIGRQLMSMVESLMPFGEDEDALDTNLKDLLMVIYLANLSKTQLMLNEKLSLL